MKLDALYRSVISSLCFVAGGAAVIYLAYGVLSLLFWSVPVFATIFGLVWAGQTWLHYRWSDPEWQDRARILIRMDDEEEEDDDDE